MSDKVWKKENSQKPERIWLPLKRTTKKSELKPLKDKEKKKVDLSYKNYHYLAKFFFIKFAVTKILIELKF